MAAIPLAAEFLRIYIHDMSCNSRPEPLSLPGTPDPSARFGRLLGRVFRKWRRYIDDEFRSVGFTDATRTPLITLHEHPEGMRQRDLALRLGLEPSALVRVIALLTERGLVTWTSDPEDRRSKCILLTPQGKDAAEMIIARSMEIERRFLAEVTKEELAAMRSALLKISDAIPDG